MARGESNTSPLRGVVIHAIRNRGRQKNGRYCTLGPWYPGHLNCRWCFRYVDGNGLAPRWGYHDECRKMRDAFWGKTRSVQDSLYRCAKCGVWGDLGGRFTEEGDVALEVDHRVSLKIAEEVLGHRGWVLALMPGNLQYLCRQCHVTKTKRDRFTLRTLRPPNPEENTDE